MSSSFLSLLQQRKTATTTYRDTMTSPLETLPTEIIIHILTFLSPVTLAALSATSHLLRSHCHTDILWEFFVRHNVPPQTELPSPSPANSWRDLYISHHPYWFLPRNKIWFSDQAHNGGVLIARYDHRRGCIEAYRLIARHRLQNSLPWTHNPTVHIHEFKPEIRLWVDDPVIKLDYKGESFENRLQKEIPMQTGFQQGICSLLSLCCRIPTDRQYPGMSLWPPPTIPSVERVRNESPNRFRGDEQRPRSLSEAGERTFRIRKWLEFSNLMETVSSVRMGEDVTTWSTLLEESVTPTKRKPWQGIWVGDYSAHGCEFLLVIQRDTLDRSRLRPVRRASTEAGLPSGVAFIDPDPCNADDMRDATAVEVNNEGAIDQEAGDGESDAPSGRLEAIKLTGDINVPRGKCTWFADDIGNGGLVRIADEELFRGARIVKSMGHVAERAFKDDRYVSSQLIMKDHDTLAQYWEVCRTNLLSDASG